MRRFAFAYAVIAATTLVAATVPAHADDYDFGGSGRRGSRYGGSSRGSEEQQHTLSVGSGLASPSESGIFGENPAGLIYNRQPSVLGYLSAGPLHKDLLSQGLSFLAGNGWAAASLGVQGYTNTRDSGGNIVTFNFGMSTYSEFFDLAIGLNGAYRFRNSTTPTTPESEQTTWTANLGFLYNPFGWFRAGLNLYEVDQGMTSVGLGVAADINAFSTITLDSSVDRRGRGLTLKPGIGVRAAGVHLAYSYGMQVDKTAVSGITAGNTIGLGYQFNPTFRIDGYYNQVVPYFLGATISF